MDLAYISEGVVLRVPIRGALRNLVGVCVTGVARLLARQPVEGRCRARISVLNTVWS